MNKTELLRKLPSVDEVLRNEQTIVLQEQCTRPQLVEWIRTAIDSCRKKILADDSIGDPGELIQYELQQKLMADRGQAIRQVINATGILLHTNLGRAPLAEKAIKRMQEATGYANVELNLQTGKRSKRGERVTNLLAQLCNAEAALVVNNCAAATMLVLQGVAGGREVVVSRGQLVEIGGGFRLPDVFRAAGVILTEVGTTNRTYLRDYENACGENTGALIRVHRSNFLQTGFVTEPSIDELVAAKRPEGVAVIDDLGSGSMHDVSAFGLDEPSVHASVASGADLTLFSGDKLFGGPQCGMIVGRKEWIDILRRNPLMRALRVDKLTLAALEATIEIHLDGEAMQEIPLLKMVSKSKDTIRAHCERVLDIVSLRGGAKLSIVECQSQVGGGSVPGVTMPSFGIRIDGAGTDGLAQALRLGTPAIQSRVTDDGLLLDLRSVADDQIETLAARLSDALNLVRHN